MMIPYFEAQVVLRPKLISNMTNYYSENIKKGKNAQVKRNKKEIRTISTDAGG